MKDSSLLAFLALLSNYDYFRIQQEDKPPFTLRVLTALVDGYCALIGSLLRLFISIHCQLS